MRAVTWQRRREVSVDNVPDPRIEEPTDAVIRVTSSGICGSDLHLYEVLSPVIDRGDILGHEPIGVVEEVGPEVRTIRPGDRVVIPCQIACGYCFMCSRGLQTQCETTQVRESGLGAALFGYTKLYGGVPGGQAQYLRVPQAQYGPIKVPPGPPDDRYVYLSDLLPAAWQAVEYAAVPEDGSVVVLGLGPIGDMAARIAAHRHAGRVIGVDLVPERLDRARARGVDVIDLRETGDLAGEIRDRTGGRGPDSVIDAVGMQAHGSNAGRFAQYVGAILPDTLGAMLVEKAGLDRLVALHTAIELVRRGGTISLIGVYGGMTDPLPMRILFDKQIQLRMGQGNVKRWVDDIVPLLARDDDPLGTETFATHHLPLDEAPRAYEMFQKKTDGAVKVLLRP
ncbi:alcohol dehydrogenase catalytic domain-containing protein [Phytohabitans sp. ZYX-F-186]|uniref:Alcohol dehydrogenase catalytic domain-containing protein n=1 Tax=Phytohabitans maris TaxID=3071409 RepID=A0ABU0ZAX2_9ACTN|nr:alcohol dehydrogenase catalytic domain-containing protein [Phytohabitans sp. ZYX-F-186]MDQ7904180.1 alcohol dehydrogenase catalytic domain-containing protein [Phytohabitans sp. ZYX-F-186]